MKNVDYLISMSLLFSCFSGFAMDGNGSIEDPYKIATIEDLNLVSNDLFGSYVLVSDLDLSGKEFVPIGTFDKPFQGIFNGNGKTISNAKVTGTFMWDGFFKYVKGGEIRNLFLKDVDVTAKAVVGGLIGQIDGGVVENITITGKVTGTGDNVGGLIGTVYGKDKNQTFIRNCTSKVQTTGNWKVGGLIGVLQDCADVKSCLVSGTVKGNARLGGAIGYVGDDEVANPVNLVSGVVVHNMTIERANTWAGPDHICRLIGTIKDSQNTLSSLHAEESVLFAGFYREFNQGIKDGDTKTKEELQTSSFYTSIGFQQGDSETSPWVMTEGSYPELWYTTTPLSNNKLFSVNYSVYPNPTTSILKVEGDFEVKELSVYTISGQLCKSVQNNENQISVNDLMSGTYILKINSDCGVYSSVFVKK